MPKQSVLRAGFVVAGMIFLIGQNDLSRLVAQEAGQSAKVPAANSNADQAQATDATKPSNDPKANADVVDEVVVSGVVVKPDGSPAAKAIIRSMAPIPDQVEAKLGRKLTPKLYQATADAEGRFSIAINKSPYGEVKDLPRWENFWKTTPIVASLAGFGPAYLEFEAITEGQPFTLKLVDDLPIRGQLFDQEGKPVAGATVRISKFQAVVGDNLDRIISVLNEGRVPIFFLQPPLVQRNHGLREADARLLGLPDEFRSDKEGQFEISGLGKERLVHLSVAADEIASQLATVMTRDMEEIQPKRARPGGTILQPVFGSNFKLVAARSRAVEGIVVDANTGAPLPGVAIQYASFRGQTNARQRPVSIFTDQSGHFRLTNVAMGTQGHLTFLPPEDQPYFRTDKNINDGIKPVQLTVKLQRGIWITGRITDKVTHEPVPGVVVKYYPFKTNERAGTVYIDTSLGRPREGARNQTDSDGRYRIVGVAGQGLVGTESQFGKYRTGIGFKELKMDNDEDRSQWPVQRVPGGLRKERTFAISAINPAADEKEVRLDFELDPGLTTRVRFVDAAGETVKYSHAFGQGVRSPASTLEGTPDGIAIIEHLGSDETRTLHAHHADRGLGVKFEITPPYDANHEITVKLEPLAVVTGRLLDEDEPIVGAAVNREYRQNDTIHSVFMTPNGMTNSEGRFRVTLIPGNPWELTMTRRPQGPLRPSVATKLNVRAGETIDLGDLQLEGREFKPVKPNAPNDKPKGND